MFTHTQKAWLLASLDVRIKQSEESIVTLKSPDRPIIMTYRRDELIAFHEQEIMIMKEIQEVIQKVQTEEEVYEADLQSVR